MISDEQRAQFDRWAAAWCQAMTAAGHNGAALRPWGDDSYIWDRPEHAADPTTAVWSDAHQAFLAVDHLRPAWVQPSPLLRRLLAERGPL
jgi:hypothetical protein